MTSSWIAMGIAAILSLLLIIWTIRSGKSKSYKVYTADEKVLEVSRKWYDGWNDVKDMKVYHKNGKKIFIPTHWITLIEEM